MPPPERSARRPLDERALDRVRRRLDAAPAPPWLHGEVARRMAERLPVVRLQPRRIVDWGAHVGAGGDVLAAAYPAARVIAVEADAARAAATRAARAAPWWSTRRWSGAADARVAADLEPAACELLWSNMVLHGAIDPQAVFAAWHRAVAVDGFLMFSTLGPGTLDGLRRVYAAQGWPAPHAPFVDMHDLGDMLVAAGFADPVMDQETITLSWADGDAALAELRSIGGNVDPRRHAGLRTPRWRERLARAIQDAAAPGERPQLAFEVVYGHAFRPAPRPRVAAETTVPLDDLRTLVRRGRSPR